MQRYAIPTFCYVVTSFPHTFRISFPRPSFLLLENIVPDFLLIFVFVILTFFFKKKEKINVQDARKENGLSIKTMKYFTVSLVQSTWLLAQG